ncbi:hypothetical protein GGTG_13305 [Gaeumannomyces tritici R3-111a-1]|uniref:Uncharacterized protein n=1 Tax=Gaeumannomyces tritici (strain R3-111a-1) TaxID=644352 RepID=J3PIH7_GAET3|nr:hypothetical protein GGTG_13305 [Gaeumannomyces tritici R3-111a-1]EJT69196.1 hypothetical protein GGTG_13305 [Gaeumannomyces tritici R3-111a-1]
MAATACVGFWGHGGWPCTDECGQFRCSGRWRQFGWSSTNYAEVREPILSGTINNQGGLLSDG